MGFLLSILYSIVLMGAGVYAILLGHNLLPSKKVNSGEENLKGENSNKWQFTIAGLILIYFGASNLYSILMA